MAVRRLASRWVDPPRTPEEVTQNLARHPTVADPMAKLRARVELWERWRFLSFGDLPLLRAADHLDALALSSAARPANEYLAPGPGDRDA